MKKLLYQLIVLLLVALYSYTSTSKWLTFSQFKHEMLNQPFARWLAWLLIYILPAAELGIAIALLFERYRRWALLLSCILLFAFTLYAGVILMGGFNRIPCSCGGFISGMSWEQHLAFTLSLSVASYGAFQISKTKLYMYNREC